MKSTKSGFTMIELIVVVAIMAILAKMSLSSFIIYRSQAAYSVAESTIRNAITAAEGSLINVDNPPGGFLWTSQSTPGPIMDPSMAALLANYQIPRNILFSASFNSSCVEAGCEYFKIEAKHCSGNKFPAYIRYGDGFDIYVEDLPSEGCS